MAEKITTEEWDFIARATPDEADDDLLDRAIAELRANGKGIDEALARTTGNEEKLLLIKLMRRGGK